MSVKNNILKPRIIIYFLEFVKIENLFIIKNMKYFKIYGLERTGTNYTSSLIEENFDYVKVFMNIGGWKHGHLIKYPNKKIMFK